MPVLPRVMVFISFPPHKIHISFHCKLMYELIIAWGNFEINDGTQNSPQAGALRLPGG